MKLAQINGGEFVFGRVYIALRLTSVLLLKMLLLARCLRVSQAKKVS